MSTERDTDPVLLVVAAFSRHEQALRWGREQLKNQFGPVALDSPAFEFHHTSYYELSMGSNLLKQFFAFTTLMEPALLAGIKLHTNALEGALAQSRVFPEVRPLNLDPGFLSLGKFVLATTKDQAHRIYLRDGIFAEVTLRYQGGAFEPWPWTYADYKEPNVRAFLLKCREYFREKLKIFKVEFSGQQFFDKDNLNGRK